MNLKDKVSFNKIRISFVSSQKTVPVSKLLSALVRGPYLRIRNYSVNSATKKVWKINLNVHYLLSHDTAMALRVSRPISSSQAQLAHHLPDHTQVFLFHSEGTFTVYSTNVVQQWGKLWVAPRNIPENFWNPIQYKNESKNCVSS